MLTTDFTEVPENLQIYRNIICLTLISLPVPKGQYQCFATNEWGTATTNSVFVRKSVLNNFKDVPPKTLSAEEGSPYALECDPPDGWPNPSVYWMRQGQYRLKRINSSRYILAIINFPIRKKLRSHLYLTWAIFNFF